MTPTAHPAGTPGHYLPAAELSHLILSWQHRGKPPEALGAAFLKLAGGVWDRYRFGRDRDEYVQSCVLHLLSLNPHRIDLDNNPFSYLTTCAFRYGLRHRGKENQHTRKITEYAAAARTAQQLDISAAELAPDQWAAAKAKRLRHEREDAAAVEAVTEDLRERT